MQTILLIIAIVCFLSVLSHRRSRLENRIYKNVPLYDWLAGMILPVVFYLGWFVIVRNILDRQTRDIIPFDDFDILAISFLFLTYGMIGNAIHFTGKIIWRYLKTDTKSMAFKVNEMFHGKLSHYLVFLNMIFILFMLHLLEINHPLDNRLNSSNFYSALIAGVIFGASGIKAIFYTNEWFGGYNKPLFYIIVFFSFLQLSIMKTLKLSYDYYPVSLFIFTMGISGVTTFVFRQMVIFAKLGTRRKLRFLAKMLSA